MSFKKEIQNSAELEAKALDSCNSEPIQIPGHIQSYGALLAFEFESLKIKYSSENIAQYLDCPVDEIWDRSIQDFFTRKDFHEIANVASHQSSFQNREHVKIVQLKDEEIDLSLFRVEKLVVLELIPTGQPSSTIDINSHLKWTLDNIKNLDSINGILQQSVETLKSITQFDRVMAYKFHPDDSGEVIAESNNGKMDSYLGLRFPAYDIPQIARNLFFINPIRHIHTTSETGTKVLAADQSLPPLDLSLGMLRGVSEVHTQYLRNMGVSSTMSISIIVNNKLWGLFTLHNQDVRLLTSEITYTAELMSKIISMVLEQKIRELAERKMKQLHIGGEEFITMNQNSLYLQSFWKKYAANLQKLIKCDGVAYQIDQKILTNGNCPLQTGITNLYHHYKDADQDISYDNNLAVTGLKGLASTSGVLILHINQEYPVINIYFFRNQVEQKIKWAGNPKKEIIIEKANVRLHPRSSFNHFTELNQGMSEIWDTGTIALAEVAIGTFRKAVKAEKATSERLKIVVQELNHRLRNILTLVRSISRQTASGEKSIDEYIDSLEHRILALAKANDLLTGNSYNSVDVKSLLKSIIQPLSNRSENITLEGPDTKLSPEITPMMVLVIHELTTNAVKYGSLSSAKGKLDVSWQVNLEGLHIDWNESDGPLVKVPEKIGFGTSVIKNAISYEFGGKSQVDYLPEGLHAQFTIPVNLLGDQQANPFVLEQVQNAEAQQKELIEIKKINVLILEDDYINAQDIKKIVSKHDINQVEMFSNQQDALRSLGEESYNLALLDVNLKKETCLKVAMECHKQNIPFYYITGYGKSFLDEGVFPQAPVIIKPIKIEDLNNIVEKHIKLL